MDCVRTENGQCGNELGRGRGRAGRIPPRRLQEEQEYGPRVHTSTRGSEEGIHNAVEPTLWTAVRALGDRTPGCLVLDNLGVPFRL